LYDTQNFVCVLAGQQGLGKSTFSKLVSYVIEKRTANEKEITKSEFNEDLFMYRCIELSEQSNFKALEINNKFKGFARNEILTVKKKYHTAYDTYNNKIFIITVNNLTDSNTLDRRLLYCKLANIEGWTAELKKYLSKNILENDYKIIAGKFVQYIFSFFDVNTDYSFYKDIPDEVQYLNNIENDINKLVEAVGIGTDITSNELRLLLAKHNLFEKMKRLPSEKKLKSVFENSNFDIHSKRSNKGDIWWFDVKRGD
jgi:energy-coupling factor transporter ATP-binding protein EcfA2